MNPTDKSLLAGFENALGGIDPLRRTGVVTEVTGLIVQSTGPLAAVGEVCEIESSQGRRILVQRTGSEEALARNEAEANGYGPPRRPQRGYHGKRDLKPRDE